MSLTFCYDTIDKEGRPYSNIYKTDTEKIISPVNLGWAGYNLPDDIEDDEINTGSKYGLKYVTHVELIEKFFDIKIEKLERVKSPYYYVVDVFPFEFWYDERSKSPNFPQKVIDDIKIKKCKILVLFLQEAIRNKMKEQVDQLFKSWVDKYNLPDNSIVFCSGNYNFEPTDKAHVKYIPFSSWQLYDYNIKEYFNIAVQTIKCRMRRNYLYLCYNRRPHYHRQKLLLSLYLKFLLNKGLVSMGPIKDGYRIPNVPKQFFDMFPMTFDDIDLNKNQASTYYLKDFLNTYVSVITETLHTDDLFPSEKIFRPIIMGHPFMVVSSKGFLKMLKKMGYKTFDRWFDESYDDQELLPIRIGRITNQLQRLSEMTHQQLTEMLFDMLPTLQHNFQVYGINLHNKRFQKQLESEICV